MKQVFILGASSVYGVGAEYDGWGGLVKQYLHSKMYGEGGVGEKYEVFNFSKSGSTIEFVADSVAWIFSNYARSDDVTTIVSVGGNDARAVNAPDNYVCTPDEFRGKVAQLLEALQKVSEKVIVVSNGFVDEAKTTPKPSPFGDGKVSYFTNERRMLFNGITKQICKEKGIDFVSVDIDKDTWIKECLYVDGLHPNQTGYQKVFEALRPVVEGVL